MFHNLTRFIKKYDLIFILLFLLLANFCVRYFFDLHHYILKNYFDQLRIETSQTPWQEFLWPSKAKLWGGTLSSFGIGLIPLFEKLIGNTNFYLLLNSIFILTFYCLSWYSFRSKIITITVGICAAFTTLNHHVYQNGSLVIIYIPFIFCLLNLFSIQRLFEIEQPKLRWWWLWLLSLISYILSFEGWVDYFAIVVIASPFCFYLLYQTHDRVRIKRLCKIISIMFIAFLIFLVLKVKYYYASQKGEEHDLVFNYGIKYLPLIIEDIISNIFTFFYTVIITYIPPIFSFSNSFLLYGPKTINLLQNNYDHIHYSLTAYNALFLWRFYAGFAMAVFLFYMVKLGKYLWVGFNRDYFYLFLFMLMILFGAPAHILIKYRAMHSIPWLPYQAFIGQIGVILLISYLLWMAQRSLRPTHFIIITILVWTSIVSCAFFKDNFYLSYRKYSRVMCVDINR